MWPPIRDRLLAAFGARDDPAFWDLAGATVLADVGGRLSALESPPRHLLLGFARVPANSGAVHPDDHANLKLFWERDRDEEVWTAAGPHPRIKRKRGHYVVTACIPTGTARLAVAEVLVLWRPRAAWAPPTETEIGRVTHLFMRDSGDAWGLKGTRSRS